MHCGKSKDIFCLPFLFPQCMIMRLTICFKAGFKGKKVLKCNFHIKKALKFLKTAIFSPFKLIDCSKFKNILHGLFLNACIKNST